MAGIVTLVRRAAAKPYSLPPADSMYRNDVSFIWIMKKDKPCLISNCIISLTTICIKYQYIISDFTFQSKKKKKRFYLTFPLSFSLKINPVLIHCFSYVKP